MSRLSRCVSRIFMTARLRAQGISVGTGLATYGGLRIAVSEGGSLSIGRGVSLGKDVMIRVGEGATVTLGDGVELRDYCCILSGGHLEIGSGSVFVNGTMIYCNGRIEIGPDVLVAAYCHIMDVDHEMCRTDLPIIRQGLTPPRPVTIGAGAWIGAKATVCKGVSIGEGAVIGANAVVTRDVPDWTVAAGIPARVLRSRKPAEPRTSTMETAA